MSSRPLLVVCGGPDCNESYSIRSDNLATIMTYDSVKTIPSKNCTGIFDKYILSLATAKNNETKILLNRHISLTTKDSCGVLKSIECVDVAGGYIAAGTSEGTVLLWRASDGELVVEQNLHIGPLTVLHIDTSFWVLFAASSTGRAGGWCIPDLFESADPDQDWSIHSLQINDMCVSSGGRVFTVGNDKVLKCFDFCAGCEILSVSFENELTAVCLSHNESVIYVGDVMGCIYPVQLSAEIECEGTYEGHEVAITDLAISDDDRSLYSIALDSTIRRWDVASGTTISNVSVKGIPYALRWLPMPTEMQTDTQKGKKSREQRGQPKGFPKLKKNHQGNKDELVSAPSATVPILSLEEEAAIAITDVCFHKENAQAPVAVEMKE